MRGPRLTQLTIFLAEGDAPIQGRISESGEPAREFVGWLGLAAALGETIRPTGETALDYPPRGVDRP